MKSPPKRADIEPRGLLNEAESRKHFTLDLYEPTAELSEVFGNVWHVRWVLPEGRIYKQSNIPHPVQHLVLDSTRDSGLFGCSTTRFDYSLSGKDQVIGLKFRPGMGRALWDEPLKALVDKHADLPAVLGPRAGRLIEMLKEDADFEHILTELYAIVTTKVGSVTDAMRQARKAVEMIETTKDLFSVSDLSARLDVSERQLQRLFYDYVGVSPKWTIDRYRMLEAVELLNKGQATHLAELALELGYSDQSHFSNKFKALTGVSPYSYMRLSD